jgi:hypothetical protein
MRRSRRVWHSSRVNSAKYCGWLNDSRVAWSARLWKCSRNIGKRSSRNCSFNSSFEAGVRGGVAGGVCDGSLGGEGLRGTRDRGDRFGVEEGDGDVLWGRELMTSNLHVGMVQ